MLNLNYNSEFDWLLNQKVKWILITCVHVCTHSFIKIVPGLEITVIAG